MTINKDLEDPAAASDHAIVEMVQQGNKEAYNILVLRYQHKVCEVAFRYVHNHVDANDVAQEAFIRAYRALGNFRGESSFYTWLYRIVCNTAKSYLEQNQKHRMTLDVDDPDFDNQQVSRGLLTNAESPDSLIESDELHDLIIQAMNELPEELKRAILLREVEELSYEEIASLMDTPKGTVRSRIFRARQYIEEKMAQFSQGN
ncbi:MULTISPECIES: sigma-70 family RNA polymerase sigma factor [unclassified Anaerobiospirillum]|uniref:sigma-70 family RNA polymerase sigma factor n=1 Tax=unclassified Anaerobiospirillum TaxID=2647410 RepID=UPI001FF2E12C|nr:MULTISPECIES: sigma-70 family RNA polymerase sigma factor [unclassified Anaerobiospirillum]MCK0527104.1 sigma-70 family RNA polymerase sigma factor [Anaerobiospirillum sp. NML120449]MCK0533891.1 sigma-70 family RNA polymerase sigma factor [Anaerobiospirillum sp. NML120511]MCK0538919.1 sigma-70 family RNA polymerase sigma factor [Anaerobiospirillum sp. NML02-A-032]